MRIERCAALTLAAAVAAIGLAFVASAPSPSELASIERPRVIAAANEYLTRSPQTITAFHAARSAGGPHDFFSEGDYWWPDPAHPDGPYIRRDGESNPDNFVDHRRAMMRLSVEMPALTAAWLLTSDSRYAEHARRHLHAWFVDAATRMSANLQYAQAIHGVTRGRGTGIIDTIHLVEVARAIAVLRRTHMLSEKEFGPIRAWFAEYLRWVTTSPNGNRGARGEKQPRHLLGDADGGVRVAYRRSLAARHVPETIHRGAAAHADGDRRKLSTRVGAHETVRVLAFQPRCDGDDLPDPRRRPVALRTARRTRHWRALAFMSPYIRDKRGWPHSPDVQYFDEWPMRHPALLFGGLALDRPEDVALWKTLRADSQVEEVVRNFFIRQPLLWID